MASTSHLDESRLRELLSFERGLSNRGIQIIAGCDEAGRGPLAGPVIAAAVIFPQDISIMGIDDSKKLTSQKREKLCDQIFSSADAVGIGRIDPEEIDRINILNATHKAMLQAVNGLSIIPEIVLVDGRPLPHAPWMQEAVIGGDRRCFSIAAASVVAKVTRDRIMIEMDKAYPGYGFARHKGYGTRLHIEAIMDKGPTPLHRRSFKVKPWAQ